MKPWWIALWLVGLSWWGMAQEGMDAAGRLDWARLVHGASTLQNLKSYQERSEYTFYASSGREVFRGEAVLRIDLAGQRFRLELRRNGKLISVDQVEPGRQVAWTARGPAQPLAESQANELRSQLLRGWLGLRLGSKNRETVQMRTDRDFLGRRGFEITVRTQGYTTAYLLSPEGLLLAERNAQTGTGTLTFLYGNYRSVAGLTLPFLTRAYSEDKLLMQSEVLDVQVNPAFTPAEFALP